MRTRITIHRTRMRTSAFGLQTIRIKKKRISLKDWRTTVGRVPGVEPRGMSLANSSRLRLERGKIKRRAMGFGRNFFRRSPARGIEG